MIALEDIWSEPIYRLQPWQPKATIQTGISIMPLPITYLTVSMILTTLQTRSPVPHLKTTLPLQMNQLFFQKALAKSGLTFKLMADPTKYSYQA